MQRDEWDGAFLTQGDWPYPTVWRAGRYVQMPLSAGRSRYGREYGGPSYYEVLDDNGERTDRFHRTDRPSWWPTISAHTMQRRCGASARVYSWSKVMRGWM